MKILLCLHDYLPRHPGGSEVHAHQSACELVRRGHEVTVLFCERDLKRQEGTLEHGELDGVHTIQCIHQREYADVRQSFEQPAFGEVFQSVLQSIEPDVVHFHHLALWGSGVVPRAKNSGARVLLTLHDYFLLCDNSTLLRPDGELCDAAFEGRCSQCLRRHPLRAELWPQPCSEPLSAREREDLWRAAARARLAQHKQDLASADLVISPSRFLAQRFGAAGFFDPSDVEILRAGYPGALHPPRRRAPDAPLRVGFVGGIYPAKGVHVLVQAMGRLKGEDVCLDVHGHLDWFPSYVEDLRASADGAAVHFHGPYDPADVDSILAALDVCVVPSIWYENMPITIQEAFRNGLPVVATALGGMAEAVTDGVDGLTFARADDADLARCLRSLARDPALYNSLAAARTIPPTLAHVVDRLEALYR